MHFTSYRDFLTHLDSLGLFHMDLGLDRVRGFLDRWGSGNPQYPIIHVVGTNGKGSVSAFVAEIARAHGLKVGVYSSPHLVDVRERVLVDGEMLPESRWRDLGNRAMELSPEAGLTYFELLTALAFLAFEEEGVDLAVMEAGLGGRYDAVNALSADVTVFTPIGMDHEAVLGPTLRDIAHDKAGALKPGISDKRGAAVTAPQRPEALAELRAAAEIAGVELMDAYTVVRAFEDASSFRSATTELGLKGVHQADNAVTAVAAWLAFAGSMGMETDPSACREGLGRAFVPARFHRIPGSPVLIIDGAHNAHALVALKKSLDAAAVVPEAVIFTCLKDKNLDGMLGIVRSLTPGRIIVPGLPDCERAADPENIAAQIGEQAEAVQDLSAALERVKKCVKPILVCGSLYSAAEFYKRFPEYLRPTSAPWNTLKDVDVRRRLSHRPWFSKTSSKG